MNRVSKTRSKFYLEKKRDVISEVLLGVTQGKRMCAEPVAERGVLNAKDSCRTTRVRPHPGSTRRSVSARPCAWKTTSK